MPFFFICSRCTGLSRTASRPPWIFGCSVFTLPSIISGKPVCESTVFTGTLFSESVRAVPPVDRISTPHPASVLPSSTMPDLSDTLRSALVILMTPAIDLSKAEGWFFGSIENDSLY